MRNYRRDRKAFTLIELIIVVVIVGILAAIAIPRMSRGSQGAADNALAGDMTVWRSALDVYQTEHTGAYPTDNTTLSAQLTQFTDAFGNPSAVRDATHVFGPYMRDVPPLPVADPTGATVLPKGSVTIGALSGSPPSSVSSGGYGWLYDGAGNIYPNTGSVTDSAGKSYSTY